MKELILLLATIVNEIHDVLNRIFGSSMTDKDLHFWVIGTIGIILFLVVYVVFKIIEKWKFSATILSFIFTFTMLTVLVFAIEIQQAITNRGNMEFADAVMGLWGFIVIFSIYALIMGIIYSIYSRTKKKKKKGAPDLIEDKSDVLPDIEKETAVYRSQMKKTNKFRK
ncbi:hypothetical protein SAMN05878443_0406 [Carnobacterium alterfunditum]|uniref:Uncharacterized protein n=1 Tax=Carnobacterium alterfunditum TaxID=28230 RepID=A0A1N6F549_9LACT|nr:hypothetical protein [Carnobacterium alterfunditum]SIN90385.1 hypothetical protein SAMN05878443_0406 [Carnobacterium alterfunditum]